MRKCSWCLREFENKSKLIEHIEKSHISQG